MMRGVAVAGLSVMVAVTPVAAQQLRAAPAAAFGRRIDLVAGPRAPVVTGELLAAQGDSAWVLTEPARVIVVPLGSASQATIRRHGLTAAKGLTWGLVVGGLSGIGLAAACSTVASDCGGVLAGSIASGLLFGTMAAISFHVSSRRTLAPARADQLAPYARFPQGVPAGVDLSRPPDSLATEP